MKPHETWKVLDATKIQAYMVCPRKYFFEHVAGWRPEIPSVHLVFGNAWHLAMEVIMEKGYNSAALAEGYQAFEEEYRNYFSPEWDEGNKPKIPSNAMRALPQYANHYSDDLDNFEVLKIEVAGSVPIATDKSLHFKTDTICKDKNTGQYFSLEHKTSTRFSTSWAAEWRQKFQVGVYNHVLHCLYPKGEVYGVKINGIFVTSPPKMKLNGEPYANTKDNEFHRVPARRNIQAMEAWLVEANYWVGRIEEDHRMLEEETDDDQPVMECFGRVTESCTKYGPCPFLDYCSVWHNPLPHIEAPPVGFKVEHWDPRKVHAKEKVEL